jgi:hypothetical protein
VVKSREFCARLDQGSSPDPTPLQLGQLILLSESFPSPAKYCLIEWLCDCAGQLPATAKNT